MKHKTHPGASIRANRSRRHLALLLAILIVFSAAPSAIAGQAGLSLERAVEIAQERNEEILIAYEDQNNADAFVRQAKANMLPNLELVGTYQRNFTKPAFFIPPDLVSDDGDSNGEDGGDPNGEDGGDLKVEIGSDFEASGQIRLDQILFAFGRLGNALDAAKLVKRIARLGVEDVRGQLIFLVKVAYYRVLLAERVAAIQRKSLEQAESHLEQVESKLSQGTVSRFDHLRAQVEVKNRQPELISAENELALAMQDLKRIVGIDKEPDPALSDSLAFTPIEFDEEAAVHEAFSRRPDMLSLQLSLERTRKRLAIQKAARLPTLGLFGHLLFQGQADDDFLAPFDSDHRAVSTAAGITLTFPIFDGFRTKAGIQQAEAELRKAEYELSSGRKRIRLEVTKAVKDLKNIKRAYDAQQATVSLAKETYAIAETRFANGLSTRLELTDAETALEMARVNFATTLYEYDVALANLERALGRNARRDDMSQGEHPTGQEE
jgi:outer membrane protein TolC